MAGNNSSLRAASGAKEDEFYTQLTDIENELRHYRKHFKGKTVFCNCDDPFESNFFKYFVLNFNRLGLKKLIATCYATSPIANQQISLFDVLGGDDANKNKPYKAVVTKIYDATGDGGIDMLDVAKLFKVGENELTELKGDGDFRSDECLELLEVADIVVTNPPFSLFREYVATLIDYKKDFLIIGNKNAITYKEIFPLLKENRMWLGNGFSNGNAFFKVLGDASNYAKGVYDENTGLVKFRNCAWFTNLDIKKRHEDLILIKKYNPEDYPKYDNYDAINIDRVVNIPYDYDGLMGVPITFMDKYNPEQFEIIDGIGRYSILNNEETKKAGKYLSMIDGKAQYLRNIDKLYENLDDIVRSVAISIAEDYELPLTEGIEEALNNISDCNEHDSIEPILDELKDTIGYEAQDIAKEKLSKEGINLNDDIEEYIEEITVYELDGNQNMMDLINDKIEEIKEDLEINKDMSR